jgi:hypothetical protein
MAQKENVVVDLKVNTGNSAEDVKDVKDEIKGVGDESVKTAKKVDDAKGAFSSLGSSIKNLAGAGIILKIFEKFGEILGQNSKITKILSVATEALSIVVGDLVNFVSDNVDVIGDIFQNPLKYVKQLANAIKDNIIERFVSVTEAAGFLGSALVKLFQGDFKGAIDAGKEASKELLDVLTGVDDTSGKVGKLADKIVDYASKTAKAALKNVELANTAELAAERLQGLIEKADRDAEKQRQIRDDVSKSIAERIEANNKLGSVLEESQKKQLEQGALLVQAAENNLKKDRTNIEFLKAKIQAENQLAAIKAQSAGFESEQLVNRTALLLEQQNLDKTRIQNVNALFLAQKKANADIIVDDLEKAKVKKEILVEEQSLELKRLEENVALYKEGTQARVDAENELAVKKQEIANNLILADIEIQKIQYERQIEDLQFIQTNEKAKFDAKKQAIDDEQALLEKSFKKKEISERDYNKRVRELSKQRKDIDEAERVAKENNANAIGSILGALSGLAEQGTALQKGLALGQVAIDTATAISSLMATSEANPLNTLTFGGAGIAQYASGIVRILANVGQAMSILNSVPAGGTATPPSISAPSSEAPMSPTAIEPTPVALNQKSLNTISNVVSRAYVVESDITGSQKRIQRIENAARF